MLLTPGIFLRVGDNSSVRLLSPSLADTRVQLLHGQAIIEVTEIFKDNNIRVEMNGSSTRLEKEGLYSFNADSRLVQVYDGKATVEQNDRNIDLKKGRELALGGPWKAAHFDPKSQGPQDSLYAWSNLRSEYEAEASMQSARNVFVGGGAYWDGPGWYWNPYWATYGFIPGDGIWYSPFGWPFYSPWFVYSAPGWYGRGFRGHEGHGYIAGRGHGHVGGTPVPSAGHSAGSGSHIGSGFAGHGSVGGMRGGFGGHH
jgi:hypothetical protein